MREQRFTFLCTEEERRMLATLAARLQRTESDTVRLMIREAVSAFDEEGAGSEHTKANDSYISEGGD